MRSSQGTPPFYVPYYVFAAILYLAENKESASRSVQSPSLWRNSSISKNIR